MRSANAETLRDMRFYPPFINRLTIHSVEAKEFLSNAVVNEIIKPHFKS